MNYFERMQEMARLGHSRDDIAEAMMVSRRWVDMVMDTDAFRVEKGHGTDSEGKDTKGDGSQGICGERG